MAYQESLRQEYIQSLVSSIQSERTLVLIGTGSRGPVNVPTTIYNRQQAVKIFGEKGTLVEAYEQMESLLNGAPVCFVKTTGTHGILRLALNQQGGDIIPDALLLKTKEASELYNQIQVQLEPTAIHISHPQALGGHTMTYQLDRYGVMGELIAALNEDAENGKIELYAQSGIDELTTLHEPFYGCNATLSTISGASSELTVNKDFYYYCLQETYRILEGSEYQLIVPLGAYFDDILTSDASYGETVYGQIGYRQGDYLTAQKGGRRVSYYAQLLEFCQKQFDLGIFSHGIIGFNPDNPSDSEMLSILVNESYRENILSAWFTEHYHHVSVVAGSLYYDHFRSINSAVLAYAAFLHTVDWANPLTNTPIDSSCSLVTPLNKDTQKMVNKKGIVTFRESILHKGQLVVASATTLNPDPGGLSYFYNLRMCQITISGLNRLVDSYLGLHLDDLIKHNRMEKEIKSYLDLLKEIQWISDYGCAVHILEETTEVRIEISIKTTYMVDAIQINGSIEVAN